jgi:hypothetical protein
MESTEKLGPAGFGRFLHDAFNVVQTEITANKMQDSLNIPNIFLIYMAIDTLLFSMSEQNPKDPFIKELRDELSQIDLVTGKSMYSFEYAKLETKELNEIGSIIEKILRKLGVIRSGSVESEDGNECALMEEELK